MLAENTVFEGSQLIKTAEKQGRGQILNMAGQICGIMFKHESEKTLYVVGGTVWYDAVRQIIETHNPK